MGTLTVNLYILRYHIFKELSRVFLKIFYVFSEIRLNLQVTIRPKEFPTNPNRFLRVTFLRCSIAVIIDFNAGQIEDFTHFNLKACTIGNVKLGSDDIISIFIIAMMNKGAY
jgi:hypothetical protein